MNKALIILSDEMFHHDAGPACNKPEIKDGCIPPTSIIACCITGLSPAYIKRANRHNRLIPTVTKGGCGGLSDQLVTIPLDKRLPLDQKAILPVFENSAVSTNFFQHHPIIQFVLFNQPLAIVQQESIFRIFGKYQNRDSDFRQ